MTTIDIGWVHHESIVLGRAFIGDPREGDARLRTEQPVVFGEANAPWVLNRPEDVTHASFPLELSYSGQGVRPNQSLDPSLIALDGKLHTPQRRLINQGCSPRMIRTLEGRILQLVTEALDASTMRVPATSPRTLRSSSGWS